MNNKFVISGGENDFFIIQNYVLQLVAEKIITPSAFVLYSFYKSIAGFKNIKVGYKYIKQNTGLSKGNISKCNRLLEDAGLIKIINVGFYKPFIIKIIDGNSLPRRQLKSTYFEEDEHSLKYQFISEFISTWEYNTGFKYTKDDILKANMINDYEEAIELIPVLWSLDSVDSWVKNSDHSLSVFVKLLHDGKLQSFYKNTIHYYKKRVRK